MGRRSRGDGSVFFDAARGCWVGAVDIGRNPQTGRRRRRKVSAPTKTEARDKLDELRAEKTRTGTVARRDISVEQCVRALLASPPPTWRTHNSIEVNTNHAKRIIKALGARKLVRLTPGDVRGMLDKMAASGYATTTISGTKGVLALAIRRAEQENLVGRNVARIADTPAGTRKRSRSMTVEQTRQLFASGLTPWWRAYLTVGILCGLRPGELLGLTWDDIDFAAGVVRVRHCLKAVPGPDGKKVLQLEELKTQWSRRTLTMPGKAAEALRALRVVQAADKLRLGRHYSDQGIVFAGNAGQPQWHQNIRKAFKRVCERAGLGAGWKPHEQRHTFVSVLSDSGVDIEVIADAVGHINSSVTREVYRHQIADTIAGGAAAMDEIFGKATGS